MGKTFNFGHKCTTNESNANHLKSIFNKIKQRSEECLYRVTVPCTSIPLTFCHQIDYSNPAVISVDNNDYRLQIKEALKIKDLKAYNSLNANIRSCELKLW